jgi:large conductance mechanosensitive channel
MLKDFKAFISRGNVVDLAVGVIIGAAFGKIVSSLVSDIIMPPIGLLMGGVDFSNKFLVLKPLGATFPSLAAAKADKTAVVMSYGIFINVVIEFLIVALAVFLLVKMVTPLMPKPKPAAVTTKDCPYCAMAIPLAAKRCPSCTSQL